jgi:hypothetical protein
MRVTLNADDRKNMRVAVNADDTDCPRISEKLNMTENATEMQEMLEKTRR